MAGDRIGSLLLQGFTPVLGAPFAGVCRIDTDHRNTAAGDHRGQAVPELGGADAGDGAAERFPAPAPAPGLPT
jgi:hypothetical protein